MAENKGILLAKSVQKHAGRAKEKLLQNLGKVDRTADEIFDEHLTNFNRQHTCATRLQKEFSNYIRCVRAVQSASKTLMDAIAEVYESQWTGSEALYGQTKGIDTQYQQFSYKLADQVLKQLDTYALQFPEMKKKIDKRGRKLVDYDSQRHSFQSLQANAAKRKDDVKVTRGREQLDEAKSTYELLNSELHDELPALFDSRILFLVTNLQTLFACEQQFHSETSKVYADLEAIVDKLATESQRGSYTLKKINGTTTPSTNSNPSSPQQSPVKANLSIVNNVTNGSANVNGHTSQKVPATRTPLAQQEPAASPEELEPSYQNTEMVKAAAAAAASVPAIGTTSGPSINGINGAAEEKANSVVNATKGAPVPAPTSAAKLENGQPGGAVSTAVPSTAVADATELTNGTDHHPHQQPHTNQHVRMDTSHSSNSNGSEKRQPCGIPETGVSGSAATTASTTGVTAAADADETPLTTAGSAEANAASVAAAAAPADPSTTTPPTAGAAVSQTSNTNLHPHHPHHSNHHSHDMRSLQKLPPVYQYQTSVVQLCSSPHSSTIRTPSYKSYSFITTPMTALSRTTSQATGAKVTYVNKVTQTPPVIVGMHAAKTPVSPLLTLTYQASAKDTRNVSVSSQNIFASDLRRPHPCIGSPPEAEVVHRNLSSNVLVRSQQHPGSQHAATSPNHNRVNNNQCILPHTHRSPMAITLQQPHEHHPVDLPNHTNNNNRSKLDIVYEIPVGATTTDLPAGVLYRVKATYKYVREDVDELSFEVGDTINVVEYEDPEDQEDGWLMGLKEGTTERGMFPANFTRPL